MANIPYFRRLKFAFRTFFSILDYSRIPDDVAGALGLENAETAAPRPVAARPEAEAPVPEARPVEPPTRGHRPGDEIRATQILAVLQRDGRLIDFLMEDLGAYGDEQVGAAVRTVHANCRQALQRYLTLEPVVAEEEGARVTVEPGTDPAMVKVIGNAAGRPPFQGVVRHRGWQVSRIDLPAAPPAARHVVAPAEVEIE